MSFTGASVIADGRSTRSQSSPTITGGDASHGYHLLTVEGYSRTKSTPTGQSIRSCPFMVGGYLWCIYYYPNGDNSDNAEFISVYAGLLHKDVPLPKPLKLLFRISFFQEQIIDTQESSRIIRASKVLQFSKSSTQAAYQRFIQRDALEKSEYLKDDSFTIRFDILVVEDLATGTTSSPSIDVPPSDMQQQFTSLLLSEEGADVMFNVRGETIAAHRCVLAARSSVFKAELFGTMKEGVETKSPIEVHDMDARVFRVMLSFIYSDSLLLPEIEEEFDQDVMWQHLLVATDRYDLGRLRLMCEEKLCEYLDVSRLSTILTLAERHTCRGLKETCLEFLSSPANLQKVMVMGDLDSLATCHPSVLKDLVAMLATKPKQDEVVLVYPSVSSYLKHVFQKWCPCVLKDLIAKLGFA